MSTFRINKYQVRLTTNVLANKHYRIRFNNNKLVILSNHDADQVIKTLEQNFITFKLI